MRRSGTGWLGWVDSSLHLLLDLKWGASWAPLTPADVNVLVFHLFLESSMLVGGLLHSLFVNDTFVSSSHHLSADGRWWRIL